jgi:hypothetical protein
LPAEFVTDEEAVAAAFEAANAANNFCLIGSSSTLTKI